MGEKSKENSAEKLSYEQLKAYTEQTVAQAKKLYQENIELRRIVNAKDIEYAFKCLEHAKLFSEGFIKAVVARLEELLTPEQNQEEDNNKEE